MKKIIIVILIILLVIGGYVAYRIIDEKNAIYELQSKNVDDNSPDVELILLRNNKKIMFQEIWIGDVLLCKGSSPYVSKFELTNNKTLTVKINDRRVKELNVSEEK